EDGARPPFLHFVDLARDGHGLAAAEAAIAIAHTAERPFACQIAEPVRHEPRDARLERIHRMARKVEAERFALAFATHALAPLGQERRVLYRRRRLRSIVRREAEEIVLARLDGFGILVAELHRRAEPLHERGAVHLEAIEAARADERLEHAPVELLQI